MFTFDVTRGPAGTREEEEEEDVKEEAVNGNHGEDELTDDNQKINIDVSAFSGRKLDRISLYFQICNNINTKQELLIFYLIKKRVSMNN